jgi:hypothetical protein
VSWRIASLLNCWGFPFARNSDLFKTIEESLPRMRLPAGGSRDSADRHALDVLESGLGLLKDLGISLSGISNQVQASIGQVPLHSLNLRQLMLGMLGQLASQRLGEDGRLRKPHAFDLGPCSRQQTIDPTRNKYEPDIVRC